ncbi:GNAT family N-acetyltransferase [Halomonas sp. V046]|uniref:GNAT family N-acetyltransferase n=1 Tax=Halomonas sp. V046 TaxID=3459611 RepID=UPI004043F83A
MDHGGLAPLRLPGEVLATRRTRLRRLQRDDVPALCAILSDRRVMRYSLRGPCDEAATSAFVEECLAIYERFGYGPWAVVHPVSLSLMGFCGIGPERVGGDEEMSLGYRFAVRHWSRGIATEVAGAVTAYAFSATSLASLVAVVEPGNIASWRVLEKIGFLFEGETEFHRRRVSVYRRHRYQDVTCQ